MQAVLVVRQFPAWVTLPQVLRPCVFVSLVRLNAGVVVVVLSVAIRPRTVLQTAVALLNVPSAVH